MTPAANSTFSVHFTKNKRIQVVDALRGFALLGILVAHVSKWYDGGALPASVYHAHSAGLANRLVVGIIVVFVSGKFYTFFSFLFGLSFALMLTRSTQSGGVFLRRFTRRLLILGAIGFLHHLHWRGDILSIYAMLGFPMLLFRNAPLPLVLVASILLMLNLPLRIWTSFNAQPTNAQNEQKEQAVDKLVNANYQVIKHGTYLDVAQFNLREFKVKMDFQFGSGRIYITLGFFLLGLYSGRRRLFQRIDENRALFIKIIKYSCLIVLATIPLLGLIMSIYNGTSSSPKIIDFTYSLLYDLGNGALTLFYIASLTLLFHLNSWQQFISMLALVGKMALTNYILQSIFGTLIFYGYGLSLIGETSPSQAIMLAIPIFILQILFSRWWLARFQHGPLEWLWRSLTLGNIQPIRVQAIEFPAKVF